MKKFILLTLALCFPMLTPTAPQDANAQRRDGNWWMTQSEVVKLNYVVGFFDGMQLGRDFSYWGIIDENKNDPAVSQVGSSFSKYTKKYMSNVTSSQLVDGLDKFYGDYRNRRIRVEAGVWLVVNGIAGTPEGDIQKMIDSWRASSVD
jgi:hypothetical protein